MILQKLLVAAKQAEAALKLQLYLHTKYDVDKCY